MVQINELVPSRFRVGDLVTINGFGFSPTFGANEVAFDGIPEPIQSESATQITVFVPAGVSVDQYVSVAVFRNDTQDSDTGQAWIKAALSDVRDGTNRIPGQTPGTTEAGDPTRVEDVPQAQDYERLATRLEHLLFDVLATVGDLFAFDGTDLVPHPLGAAGNTLRANPAPATGMDYAAIARASSMAWGGQKAIGDVVLNELSTNGDAADLAIANGNQLAHFTGNLYRVIVLFPVGTAGDTLDQVTIDVNAGNVYDSGVGLAIVPGGFHVATFSLAVVSGDQIELKVKKAGVNGLGVFVGYVGIR